MGKVSTAFSMSLDGYIAGPNEDFQHLFAWMGGGDTEYTLTIGDREQKLKIAPASIEMFENAIKTTGALVAGRRLYELTHGWGGQIAVAGIVNTAQVAVMYGMHRMGYHRVERVPPIALTLGSIKGAYMNQQR